MPSKKQYNLVHNDEYDTRIPLHSEEAFHRGIVFHAKFIGSMDVPRPTSRVEIVAAMRRIRYEFKAKGIKKKKVTLEVSVDGLRVTLRKKKKKQQWIDENKAFLMHYPIYRIFYVSHDSHDLKIFSYIARDGNSNSFKCNVFKSSKKLRVVCQVDKGTKLENDLIVLTGFSVPHSLPRKYVPGSADGQSPGTPEPSTPGGTRPRKKLSFKEPEFFEYLRMKKPSFRAKPPIPNPPSASHQPTRVPLDEQPFQEEDEEFEELQSQAMRVVRTVGQAFEVCHKLSLNTASEEQDQEIDRERERSDDHLPRSDDYEDEMTNDRQPIIQPRSPSPNVHKDISLMGDNEDPGQDQPPAVTPCIIRTHSSASPIRQSPSGTVPSECGDMLLLGGNELTSLKHEIQLLRERLDQQGQQTRAAVAHARLLQDQLAAETAARVEAQTRTHQLLVQNKELLEHIGALVSHLREQERASGIHSAVQSQSAQGTNNPMNQQSSNVPDLSTLGQSHSRTPGQSSPWELEPPSFTYSYTPDPLYGTGGLDLGGYGASNDQLHFQTQLLERLHNISPYQTHQRSPYATPSPYPLPAQSFLLSPTGKPSNSQASVRLSQANSFASSPVMSHKIPSYTSQSEDALSDLHALIKPLPCTLPRQRNSLHFARDTQEARQQQRASCPPQTTVTPQSRGAEQRKQDSPRPQGSPARETPSRETQSSEKNIPKSSLATILRSPGPPPSRTTSARLPARNDLMSEVQRKTWARHTTK